MALPSSFLRVSRQSGLLHGQNCQTAVRRSSRVAHVRVCASTGNGTGSKSWSDLSVIGICGSLRDEKSYTKKALKVAMDGAASLNCNVELIDLKDLRLFFCDGGWKESKNKEQPNDAELFRQKIKAADAVILATPEYHGSYSGVLKNALDLTSIEEWEGKVVGLVAIAAGLGGGQLALNHLQDVCRSLHAFVCVEQCFVPHVWKNLEAEDFKKRLFKVGEDAARLGLLHANKAAILKEHGVELDRADLG